MAWVTLTSKTGTRLRIPETVYENMYKTNEHYSILEVPKPTPKLEEEKTEVVNDDSKVQRPVNNANRNSGKSAKKAIS